MVEQVETALIPLKDLDQDKRIVALEQEVMLLRETRGSVNVGEYAKIIGVAVALVSGLLTMYIENKTSDQKATISLLEATTQDHDKILDRLGDQVAESDDGFRRSAEEIMRPTIDDVSRVEIGLEKVEDSLRQSLAEVVKKVDATIDEKVVEQRLASLSERIESNKNSFDAQLSAIAGRFERITEVRLTGQIQDNGGDIEDLQAWQLETARMMEALKNLRAYKGMTAK